MNPRPSSFPHRETLDRFLSAGDLDSAFGLATLWTVQEPTNTVAWTTLARVHQHQGDGRAALQALEQAVQTDSQTSSVHFALGVQYHALGNFDKAVEAFQACIEVMGRQADDVDDPYDTFALLALAQCHAHLGQPHQAILLLRQVDDHSTVWLKGRVSPATVRETIRHVGVIEAHPS